MHFAFKMLHLYQALKPAAEFKVFKTFKGEQNKNDNVGYSVLDIGGDTYLNTVTYSESALFWTVSCTYLFAFCDWFINSAYCY